MSDTLPRAVLTDRLQDAIGGRQVRVALFTTFSFDPAFFELEVLPALFESPFSQVESVRLAQLEDELRSVDELAIYYDRTALSSDAGPARLDARRIDVRRKTGVFHPKVVLLLVEDAFDDPEPGEPPPLSLIAGILSANLTRSGWWESVETAHFEELKDRNRDDSRCNWRVDLLKLLRSIRRCAVEGEDHSALGRIQDFLRRRASKESYSHHRSRGRFHTRIFCGQSALPEWLQEIGVGRHDTNLEIISPFFDGGYPSALEELLQVVRPKETRLYLPTGREGEALIPQKTHDAAIDLGATWSTFRGSLLQGSPHSDTPPRGVHAKLYRFWSRDGGEVVVVGSANLTRAGHSSLRSGNLEASYLLDRSDAPGRREWWLTPLEKEVTEFQEETTDETEGADLCPIDLLLRYDWESHSFEYLLLEENQNEILIEEISGASVAIINLPETGSWIPIDEDSAGRMERLLLSTSLVRVRHARGESRILVREEGLAQRPSLLKQLTPEEILLYWSLLTAAQRAAFLEEKLLVDGSLEGLLIRRSRRYDATNTLFDRFSGLFHAFGRLQSSVTHALSEERFRVADVRLFGEKHDSLPVLLRKVLDRDGADPIMNWLTFLCAEQLVDQIGKADPDYSILRPTQFAHLRQLLAKGESLRKAIPIPPGAQREEFLDWYQQAFLKRADSVGETP